MTDQASDPPRTAPVHYSDALHPYSPVRRAGQLLFIAGQLGVLDNAIVPGGVAEQTHQALRNLDRLLVESGCRRADVVKTTVFLADSAERLVVDPIYLAYFGDGVLPVRTCVTVAELPFRARVEIEAVAELNGAS